MEIGKQTGGEQSPCRRVNRPAGLLRASGELEVVAPAQMVFSPCDAGHAHQNIKTFAGHGGRMLSAGMSRRKRSV